VISVASVDKDLQKSSFSQWNDMVDIAAPGMDIYSISTKPEVVVTDDMNNSINAVLMTKSPVPEDEIVAEPVHCFLAQDTCQDAFGKICIIERGDITFAEKARNCQAGGGIAAMVFNNEGTNFAGTLGDDVVIKIPVFSLSQEDGLKALQALVLRIVVSSLNYETISGTSMSVPHVSGVITKIWAALPGCTNHQVREAIEVTAMDLGYEGRDDYFGHGLIQAVEAYKYLQSLPAPCGQSSLSNGAENISEYDYTERKEVPQATKVKMVGDDGRIRGSGGGGGNERRNLRAGDKAV
jgi:serine protease